MIFYKNIYNTKPPKGAGVRQPKKRTKFKKQNENKMELFKIENILPVNAELTSCSEYVNKYYKKNENISS